MFDFDTLIEEYKKIVEYLPDYEKGILEGINIARDFIALYEQPNGEIKTILDKIKAEGIAETAKELKTSLGYKYGDYLISFVEKRDYVIDKNGNVINVIKNKE